MSVLFNVLVLWLNLTVAIVCFVQAISAGLSHRSSLGWLYTLAAFCALNLMAAAWNAWFVWMAA